MYKVVIADDEPHILNYLNHYIPWEDFSLQVVGCASNGKDAYNLALTKKADILITDIRMPEMDGLQLCEKLKELLPEIQIIIISAYSDFSYAQKAIQLHALGYCLKPLVSEDLSQLLHIAIRLLNKHKTLHYDELLDVIEDGSPAEIQRCFRKFGLNCKEYYVAASIHASDITDALHAKLTIKLGKHKYLYFSNEPFHTDNAKQFICYCKKLAGIAVFPDPVSPANLKYCVEDVVVMSFQYFLTGYPTYSEELVDGSLTDDFFQKLTKSFERKSELTALLNELKTINASMIFNIRTAYKFYHMVLHCPLMESAFDTEEYLLYGYEQLVTEYKNFQDMLNCLLKLMCTSNTQIADETAKVSSFMQIIKYLNENYQQDISLQQLADSFHLNASYISFLIKKETGLTYSQYLTNLRISQAKRLLTSSQLTLTEISESVGFHDNFYFIKKFKKITGVTPGYYQKNLSSQWNHDRI